MERLHKLATLNTTNEDSMALKYLLGGFENKQNNSDTQRAESWGVCCKFRFIN